MRVCLCNANENDDVLFRPPRATCVYMCLHTSQYGTNYMRASSQTGLKLCTYFYFDNDCVCMTLGCIATLLILC